MKRRKNNLAAKIAVGVMSAALALSSSAMAFAEEQGNAGNLLLADNGEECVEYTEATPEPAYAMMNLNPLERVTQLRWTVLADNRLESVPMYIEAGQYLQMAGAADPSDVSFKYGYTNHNTDWYCWGQGSFGHTFQIATSGYYHIYFRNTALFKNVSINFIYAVTDD